MRLLENSIGLDVFKQLFLSLNFQHPHSACYDFQQSQCHPKSTSKSIVSTKLLWTNDRQH